MSDVIVDGVVYVPAQNRSVCPETPQAAGCPKVVCSHCESGKVVDVYGCGHRAWIKECWFCQHDRPHIHYLCRNCQYEWTTVSPILEAEHGRNGQNA